MADESIGGVSVSITGDAGPLQASFAAAQSSASAAGARVASAFNEGAGATDQMANAAIRAAAAEAGFEQVVTKTNAALHTQVTDIQAVSGTLRTLDGNQGIRAAERFLTMIPGLAPALQAAFPLIGAIAFAEVVGRAVEHFQKLSTGAGDAANAVQRAFREINLGAQESNDSLQVANDRLENEIAKIEKKPENGIKLALDEAILSADQLGKSLDSDLGKLTKLLTEQKTGLIGQIFGQASTSDIETEVQQFQDRVAKVTASSRIPRQESFGGVSLFSPELLQQQKTAEQTRVNTELTALYSAEIQKLQRELKTAYGAGTEGAVDNTRRVELLTASIANLKAQAQSIDLKGINANLQGEKGTAQAAAEAARAREEANRKAEESARRQEEIYELSRRVWAETQAEIARDQDELNRAAQRLYDTNKRAAEEADNAARKMALSSNELANKSSQLLSGVKPENSEKNEAVNQQALQRLQGGNVARLQEQVATLQQELTAATTDKQRSDVQGRLSYTQGQLTAAQQAAPIQQQLALAIQLKQVGIETNNEIQSRVGNLQQELAAAQKTNVPIETRLKLEEEILQAKIQQAAANGQGDQTDKLAAAQNQIQQTLVQWKSLNFGDIAQSSTKAVIAGVDGISQAMARAIVAGKGFGKAMTDSLKQIGTSIIASAIEVGLKRIIAGLLGMIPAFSAVSAAQGAAAATQKAVAEASVLTAAGEGAAWGFESVMAALPFPVNVAVAPVVAANAFAQTEAFGAFAGGTDSAPGGFAVVGEKGPEIMYVPRGAQITPNNKIGSYAGGTSGARSFSSSSSTSIGELHVHAHGVSNPDAFAKAAVAAIPREIKRQTSKASPYSN